MEIAITIVHNKSDKENKAQIEYFKPLILIKDVVNDQYNDNGRVVGQFITHYYTLDGFPEDYKVKFYQVIPFGVTPPDNLYEIDSVKVYYAKGDEDKTGDHPQFFNWGLKRGTDNGADLSIYLEDHNKFDVKEVLSLVNEVGSNKNRVEFAEHPSAKLASVRLLTNVGQLKTDQALDDPFVDLKQRVIDSGMEVKNG